jgi:methylthioribose-1-phosphate isomerase
VSEAVRPIDWVPDDPAVAGGRGRIRLLDQTLLPEREHVILIDDVGELIEAIQRLAVRGAPALGVAGAMGVALLAQRLEPAAVGAAAVALRRARPTAVNLARGVDQALAALPNGPAAVLAAALAVRDGELRASELMARNGADFLYRTARFEQAPAARHRAATDDDLQHRGPGRRRTRHRVVSDRAGLARRAAAPGDRLRDPAVAARVPD